MALLALAFPFLLLGFLMMMANYEHRVLGMVVTPTVRRVVPRTKVLSGQHLGVPVLPAPAPAAPPAPTSVSTDGLSDATESALLTTIPEPAREPDPTSTLPLVTTSPMPELVIVAEVADATDREMKTAETAAQ